MNVRGDQLLRGLAMVCSVAGYLARLVYVGNGEIAFLSYQFAPYSFLGLVLVLLALPETIDMLPIGPNRTKLKK